MSVLSEKHFHDEAAAYRFVEARVWPKGPVCPHCKETSRIGKMKGKSTRIGTYKCYACRKPFTVKIGTIFEASHVKMHLWLQAIFLMSSSKKGISSNQLHRTLGVTLKTAWFMSHRIREAMRDGVLGPLGGEGKIVEADETYYGKQKNPRMSEQRKNRPHTKGGAGVYGKRAILGLVERGGNVRTFHVAQATSLARQMHESEQDMNETVSETARERQARTLSNLTRTLEKLVELEKGLDAAEDGKKRKQRDRRAAADLRQELAQKLLRLSQRGRAQRADQGT